MSDEETTLPAVLAEGSDLMVLDTACIVPSRTNPRTYFDEAFIQDLSKSIKRVGVLQPILVRPLPGDRVQETAENRLPGDPLPTHEIIAGEQRWRASKLADLARMPVLVRHLNDQEVLELQLVENLKRKDLHPLEEAEGFQALIDKHGMAVEDIAAKVDKSASQIYVTLKLLDLTPDCRQELLKGNLTRSTALLVARAPAELQAKIAKDIVGGTYGQRDEPMSYREAKLHIQQHYMLQLGAAIFDIKDASLVTKAGCTDCQKRTGANRTLFGDIEHADTCTDPKCFDTKKEAHFAAVAKKAAAAGKTVIQGKEAAALIPHAGATPKGYKLLDEKEYIEGRTVSVRNAIGKEALEGAKTVLIVDPHTKETREAIKADVAGTLLANAKQRLKAQKQAKATGKDPSETELAAKYEEQWQSTLLTQVHERLQGDGIQEIGNAARTRLVRSIAERYAENAWGDMTVKLCALFGIGKVGSRAGLQDYVRTCADSQLGPALVLLMVNEELYESPGNPEITELVAEQLGLDVKGIQSEVKAAMKAEAKAREAKVQPQAAKAAAGKKAAKPKTTTAEASAGIAQALQAQEQVADQAPIDVDTQPPALNFRVRIKGGQYGGLHGTILSHIRANGNRPEKWKVNLDDIREPITFARDGFVVTEPLPQGMKMTPAWPLPVKDDAAGARV